MFLSDQRYRQLVDLHRTLGGDSDVIFARARAALEDCPPALAAAVTSKLRFGARVLPFETWSPFWFAAGVGPRAQEELAVASVITSVCVLIVDDHDDGKLSGDIDYVLEPARLHRWHDEARRLFGGSAFPEVFARWRQLARKPAPEIDEVLRRKNPFYTLIAGTFQGTDGCASADALARALGILDDLLDMAADWRQGLPSSVLLELAGQGAAGGLDEQALLLSIIRTGLIERRVRRAVRLIDEARDAALPEPCPAYALFLTAMREALTEMVPFLVARVVRELGGIAATGQRDGQQGEEAGRGGDAGR